MIQAIRDLLTNAGGLQLTPAGLLHPLPAHRAQFCSIRSPCYVSRTIESAALSTETDSPVHS
jgi:hypothetical protein